MQEEPPCSTLPEEAEVEAEENKENIPVYVENQIEESFSPLDSADSYKMYQSEPTPHRSQPLLLDDIGQPAASNPID
jgi:hypothetical protein